MSQTCNSKEQEFGRDNVAVEGRGGSEVVTPEVFASRFPARKEGEPASKASYLCRE